MEKNKIQERETKISILSWKQGI